MKLFYEGGPIFMGILTFVFIAMVAWAVYHFLPVLLKKEINPAKTRSKLNHIKTIGTFGMVTGILGQLIGLISAFDAIQKMGNVEQGILAGGLKVSTIPTVYGLLIFLFSLFLWFILDNTIPQKSK